MLIDANHRPTNGAARPTLCAYHTDRLRAAIPMVEPEILAAELLAKQLARKRIARRDAIALAYTRERLPAL